MPAWDRRTGETIPAWRGFQAYRDLGPGRSIPRAMEAAGKPPGGLRWWERWSSKHQWVARARAWDEHLDQLVQEKQRSAAQEAAERHARFARNIQGAAGIPLQELARRMKDQGSLTKELQKMTLEELFEMLRKAGPSVDRAMKIERLILGEPTDRLDHQGFIVERVPVRELESAAEPVDAED